VDPTDGKAAGARERMMTAMPKRSVDYRALLLAMFAV